MAGGHDRGLHLGFKYRGWKPLPGLLKVTHTAGKGYMWGKPYDMERGGAWGRLMVGKGAATAVALTWPGVAAAAAAAAWPGPELEPGRGQ